jgi:uncharacterized membrane protein
VDEGAHFYRGYEITSGKFAARNIDGKIGDELPQSLSVLASRYVYLIKNIDAKTGIQEIAQTTKIKLDEDKTTFTEFKNTALYSPACYMTQIPGMFIAKILKLNPLAIFYAGRISNLLFYCFIVYFAIKIVPFFKLPLMLIALMPMSLSLAASNTSDVGVIGLNFLWIALILNILSSKEFKAARLWFFPFAAMIALTKYCILLLPLIFLLPAKIFKNRRQYITYMVGVVFTAVLCFLIWQAHTEGFALNINDKANAAAQFKFIISNPIGYLCILLKTFIIKTPRVIITMIGVFGWQDTRLDFLTYIIYPVLIYFAVISDNFDFKLQKNQKTIALTTVLFALISICTYQYLTWSEVGSKIIIGLSGKYFIPLVMPALLLFKNGDGRLSKHYDTVKIFIIIAVILILFSSDLSLLHRFYGLTPQLHYKI